MKWPVDAKKDVYLFASSVVEKAWKFSLKVAASIGYAYTRFILAGLD